MDPQRHLWNNQWFRDLLVILVVVILLWMAYSLRAILLPIIMALALAYAFDPLISWLHGKARIPRWLSTTGLLAITLAGAVSVLLWLAPQLINQTSNLIDRLPSYTDYAAREIKDLQQWVEFEEDGEVSIDPDVLPDGKSSPEDQSSPEGNSVEGNAVEGNTFPPASTDESQSQQQPSNALPVPSASSPAGGVNAPASSSVSKAPAEVNSAEVDDPTNPAIEVAPAGEPMTDEAASQENAMAGDTTTGQAETAGQGRSATPGGKASPLSNALSNLDMSTLGSVAVKTFNVGVNTVAITFTFGTYLALSAALLLLGFFFFSWKFDRIKAWGDTFIPHDRRERAMHIIHRMDESVSAFVRGRLIQVAIITCLLCGGWAWAGVPYWLLLGVLGGMLNIVPYAAVVAWPLAILVMWIDTASGGSGEFSFTHVFVWPSVVYIIAQTLDGWVVEPLVQGKATNLDPFSVLVAVIVGGSLLGVLGMIIAVPVTACAKILCQEVILPHIRWQIHGKPMTPPMRGDKA